MAEENQTNEVEELEAAAAETVEAAVEEVDESAEAVTDAVEEAVDQKVEDAVRHVAEEAAAEEAATLEAIAPEQVDESAPVQEDAPEAVAKKKRERRSKQARAAKSGVATDELSAASKAADASKATLGTPAWIAISVACLALGLVIGRFLLGGGGAAAAADLAGKTTVEESELDNAYATFTYDGSSEAVTIREVIELNGTLDTAKTDEGTYTLPSAEYAISVARTKILNKEIEARNIEVTEEEVATYAEENLGTSDFEAIATTYGMEAETVKQLITDNCRLSKLRDEIVGETTATMPSAPATAEEGKEDEFTKEYADYILGIIGDEWDAENGTWVDSESSYAVALDGTDFSADGASYNMAQTVYYVAYQKYNEQQTEASNTWTAFLNELLSKASIEINSMVS